MPETAQTKARQSDPRRGLVEGPFRNDAGWSGVTTSVAYEESPAAVIRRRRRVIMQRFIICEILVAAVIATSVIAGISERFATPSLTPLFKVVPIGAAIMGTVVPIFFFGDPKSRLRRRR